jgi:hypothetical protein
MSTESRAGTDPSIGEKPEADPQAAVRRAACRRSCNSPWGWRACRSGLRELPLARLFAVRSGAERCMVFGGMTPDTTWVAVCTRPRWHRAAHRWERFSVGTLTTQDPGPPPDNRSRALASHLLGLLETGSTCLTLRAETAAWTHVRKEFACLPPLESAESEGASTKLGLRDIPEQIAVSYFGVARIEAPPRNGCDEATWESLAGRLSICIGQLVAHNASWKITVSLINVSHTH